MTSHGARISTMAADVLPSTTTDLPGQVTSWTNYLPNVMSASTADVQLTWTESASLDATQLQSADSDAATYSRIQDGGLDVLSSGGHEPASIAPSDGFPTAIIYPTSDVYRNVDVYPTSSDSLASEISLYSDSNLGTDDSLQVPEILSSTPSLPPMSTTPKNYASSSSGHPVSLSSSITFPVLVNTESSRSSWSEFSSTMTSTSVPSVSRMKELAQGNTAILTRPSGTSRTISRTFVASATNILTSSLVPQGPHSRGPTLPPGIGVGNTAGIENPNKGYPNETILFIIVPVGIVVLLIATAIIIACVRRRKITKLQSQVNQNPDLWVNTQPEISLVPTPQSIIESHAIISPGFKPGDRLYQVVYGFSAQLDGQMTLVEKEMVTVIEKADNGWWRGTSQVGDKSGWFPECYVEEVKADKDEGTQSLSKGKSRVSSFMLKKRERNRRRSAAAVSPVELKPDQLVPGMIPLPLTVTRLNSSDIHKFNDGRLYKALFTYRGASKGELSILEGEILRGWEKDRNGWMHGRKVTNGEEGWFPAVYVDEVPSDTSSISGESTLSNPIMYEQLAPNKTKQTDQDWLGIEHRAIHPYTGQSDADLSFDRGDTIVVYETLDNGWWLGSRGDEVGWLPGTYLELLDTSRDDDSKSDVSSVLSSLEDRPRGVDEVLDIAGPPNLNTSTVGDHKPKPARKAPPPPPKKMPQLGDGGHVSPDLRRELNDVLMKSVQGQEAKNDKKTDTVPRKPKVTLGKTKTSRPKRPAPAPPKKTTENTVGQGLSPAKEIQPASVVSSPAVQTSATKVKPNRPALPKRFAKPKVISVPRRSSKLENLSVNSRPSGRRAPPRPPPPKHHRYTGKPGKYVQSSKSFSGIYVKNGNPDLVKTSSLRNMTETTQNVHPQSDVKKNVTPPRKVLPVVPPVIVPSTILSVNMEQSDRSGSDVNHPVPHVDKPKEVTEMNTSREEVTEMNTSTEVPPVIGAETPNTSSLQDPVDSHSESPDGPVTSDDPSPYDSPSVYPVMTGPTILHPLLGPISPVNQQKIPQADPIDPISMESPTTTGANGPEYSSMTEQIHKGTETDDSVPVDINDNMGNQVDQIAQTNSSGPKISPRKHTKSNSPSPEKDIPKISPRTFPNGTASPKVSPRLNVIGNDLNTEDKKPVPTKPLRVPPPLLPKPKVLTPPAAVVVDVPPEGVKGRVSHMIKEIDKLGNSSRGGSPVPPAVDAVEGSRTDNLNDSMEFPPPPPVYDEEDFPSECVENGVDPVSRIQDLAENSGERPQGYPLPGTEDNSRNGNGQPLINGDVNGYGSANGDSDVIGLHHEVCESYDLAASTDMAINGGRDDSEDDTCPHLEDILLPADPSSIGPAGNGQHDVSGGPAVPDHSLNNSVGPDAVVPLEKLEENHLPESDESSDASTDNPGQDPPVMNESPGPHPRPSFRPPNKPPPPKSPTPKARTLVNQEDPDKPTKKMLRRAVKAHVPEGKGELTFEEGSFIKEVSKAMGRPGWCIGMLADGTTGLYPLSHVEDAANTMMSIV